MDAARWSGDFSGSPGDELCCSFSGGVDTVTSESCMDVLPSSKGASSAHYLWFLLHSMTKIVGLSLLLAAIDQGITISLRNWCGLHLDSSSFPDPESLTKHHVPPQVESGSVFLRVYKQIAEIEL